MNSYMNKVIHVTHQNTDNLFIPNPDIYTIPEDKIKTNGKDWLLHLGEFLPQHTVNSTEIKQFMHSPEAIYLVPGGGLELVPHVLLCAKMGLESLMKWQRQDRASEWKKCLMLNMGYG